jgi:hypothetical protein
MIFVPRQMLLRLSNRGERNEQGTFHGWRDKNTFRVLVEKTKERGQEADGKSIRMSH